MNESQQTFLVFYAIFWGMVANVQPKWKAFQLPLIFDFPPARHRVLLSFIVLNILPILFFGWTIWMLSGSSLKVNYWNLGSIIELVIHSIIPAFSTFGFYRLWLGIVELKPNYFYVENSNLVPDKYRKAEPTLDDLTLTPKTGLRNIMFALSYIICGLIASQILR